VLEYDNGLRAVAIDDCFSWADRTVEWRVEGIDGIAKGRIGWTEYPAGSPSTLDVVFRDLPTEWHRPRWKERWFPQAFTGTMSELMAAVADGSEPAISGRANLKTMAVIEAGYRSIEQRRTVELSEFSEGEA